ncbi:MAG: hypothetical protein ACKV2U_15695 [Bryobacteraceae bacterium]
MQNLIFDDPMLEQWIRGALLLPDEQFSPIEPLAALLARPLTESKGTLSVFLQERVDPHRGAPGVRWSAHAGGMDLLRAKYKAAGLQLAVTESVNFAFVWAGLAPAEDRRAYLEELIRTVVKTDTVGHHWQFDLPSQVDGLWEFLLISNRGAPSLRNLESRHDRADLMLWSDTAYFLFYKKVDQREGFQREDGWFSAAARGALKRN